jgi:hypothetical protein
VYFRDPEGNRVELLIDTPWYVPQPCRIPVDLSLPDDALWSSIEKKARELPGFTSRVEWQRGIAEKISAATAKRSSGLQIAPTPQRQYSRTPT